MSPRPPLRILDTGLKPARWNVAMTAALAERHSRHLLRANPPPPCGEGLGVGGPRRGSDPSPPPHRFFRDFGREESAPFAKGGGDAAACAPLHCDTVRFHRYPPCVLIGASQDAASAADVEYCRQAGIEIARRVTGGGAVYMSPAMLAWDVLLDRREHGGDLAGVTERVCGGVAAGLSRLGVPARFRSPNDIAVRERKVSGSSGYAVGRTAVLQGTVLISDEVAVMARALRLAEADLRERVSCLAAEAGSVPALRAVLDCIAAGLAEALGCAPAQDELDSEEIALCDALLRDGIGTEAGAAGMVGGRPAPA